MNQALNRFLSRLPRPAYLLLFGCSLIFLLESIELTALERRAIPAIAELHAEQALSGNGLGAFIREYMADPFGKARQLTDTQIERCRELTAMVPEFEAATSWRNTALFTAIMTLLLIAYKEKGLPMWRDLRKKLASAASQEVLRRAMANAGKRFPMPGAARNKQAPVKEAVVSSIIECPACHKELRVPAGKGRIRITCPACGNKFEAVT